MNEWFCLAFGFALLSILTREESRVSTRVIAASTVKLLAALALLVVIDTASRSFLWNPIRREGLASVTFFLWALLIDEGMSRIGRNKGEKVKIRFFVRRPLVALLGFSSWVLSHRDASLLWGLGLPLASGLAEWLLEGLRDRLRLASVPRVLEGGPILLWLSMLLWMAFGGFVN